MVVIIKKNIQTPHTLKKPSHFNNAIAAEQKSYRASENIFGIVTLNVIFNFFLVFCQMTLKGTFDV